MAIDYGEKEREFLDGLKESTGRDLAEWMTAITEQDLPHRNDIIDWLRHRGFMFSQASWLERIHHNGGRPIYADSVATGSMPSRAPRERTEPRLATPANDQEPEPQPEPPPPPIRLVATATEPAADLSSVLAKAKAYRPLAQHLITQIKSVRPAAQFVPRATAVAISDPLEFAVLAITGKELRLYLALGEDDDGGDVFKKATAAPGLGLGLGKGEKLTHMLVLTDARQIDRHLLGIVARAAAKVNSS